MTSFTLPLITEPYDPTTINSGCNNYVAIVGTSGSGVHLFMKGTATYASTHYPGMTAFIDLTPHGPLFKTPIPGVELLNTIEPISRWEKTLSIILSVMNDTTRTDDDDPLIVVIYAYLDVNLYRNFPDSIRTKINTIIEKVDQLPRNVIVLVHYALPTLMPTTITRPVVVALGVEKVLEDSPTFRSYLLDTESYPIDRIIGVDEVFPPYWGGTLYYPHKQQTTFV